MRDVPSFDRRSLVLAAATVASLWLAGCGQTFDMLP